VSRTVVAWLAAAGWCWAHPISGVFRPTLVVVQPGATRIGYTGVGIGGPSCLGDTRSTACQPDSRPGSGGRWVLPSRGISCVVLWRDRGTEEKPWWRRSSQDPQQEARGPQRARWLRRKQRVLSRAESGMSNGSMSFQQWAAKLSQPSVELKVQDDHVVLEEDGELIASGALG
jgi:hypothetical protein